MLIEHNQVISSISVTVPFIVFLSRYNRLLYEMIFYREKLGMYFLFGLFITAMCCIELSLYLFRGNDFFQYHVLTFSETFLILLFLFALSRRLIIFYALSIFCGYFATHLYTSDFSRISFILDIAAAASILLLTFYAAYYTELDTSLTWILSGFGIYYGSVIVIFALGELYGMEILKAGWLVHSGVNVTAHICYVMGLMKI